MILKRILVAIVCALICVPQGAFAADKEETWDFPRLISYDELIRLPPAKRESYLESLRVMLVDLARIAKYKKLGLFVERADEIAEYYAFLEMFFPRAVAAEASDCSKDEIFTRWCDQMTTGENCRNVCLTQAELDRRVRKAHQLRNGTATPDVDPAPKSAPLTADPGLQAQIPGERLLGQPDPNKPPEIKQADEKNGYKIGADEKGTPLFCPSAKVTCHDDKSSEYRKGRGNLLKEYHKEGNAERENTCVHSGNFSSYQGGKPAAGKCEAPTEFCFGGCSAPGKAGDSPTVGKSAALKCDKAKGESICNPVFGTEKTEGSKVGKALCVTRAERADATTVCYNKSQALKAKGQLTLDFWNGDEPGIKDSWDQYAERFNNICRLPKQAQGIHCEECKAITYHLGTMHAIATNNGCKMLSYAQWKDATKGQYKTPPPLPPQRPASLKGKGPIN